MKRVFLSGIAGTGMSALAGLYHQVGWEVHGSDANFYPPVDRILQEMGARLYHGYRPENLAGGFDLCIIGNVQSRGNAEVEAILNSGLEYCSMAEALYRHFIHGRRSIVVAGSHGKTTISAFIAFMLQHAGLRPGFFIGGKPLDFPANSQLGDGAYFVSEGDEYETAFFDRSSKFLKYRPDYLVLTALEYDHLDFFPSESAYLQAFQNLVNQVPGQGLIVVNDDYPMNRAAVRKAFTPLAFYGTAAEDWRISACERRADGYRFVLQNGGRSLEFFTPLDGRYNVWNLTAGIVLGLHLGLDEAAIRAAVATFSGVERRCKVLGTPGRAVFVEDFAHHPTAIRAVLQSLRETWPGHTITAVFEPRSASLRRDTFRLPLTDSLAEADEVIMTDVFAREKIPADIRLDVPWIVAELQRRGRGALLAEDPDHIRREILRRGFDRPVVYAILSNGSFGGLPQWAAEL